MFDRPGRIILARQPQSNKLLDEKWMAGHAVMISLLYLTQYWACSVVDPCPVEAGAASHLFDKVVGNLHHELHFMVSELYGKELCTCLLPRYFQILILPAGLLRTGSS